MYGRYIGRFRRLIAQVARTSGERKAVSLLVRGQRVVNPYSPNSGLTCSNGMRRPEDTNITPNKVTSLALIHPACDPILHRGSSHSVRPAPCLRYT